MHFCKALHGSAFPQGSAFVQALQGIVRHCMAGQHFSRALHGSAFVQSIARQYVSAGHFCRALQGLFFVLLPLPLINHQPSNLCGIAACVCSFAVIVLGSQDIGIGPNHYGCHIALFYLPPLD